MGIQGMKQRLRAGEVLAGYVNVIPLARLHRQSSLRRNGGFEARISDPLMAAVEQDGDDCRSAAAQGSHIDPLQSLAGGRFGEFFVES